jgi:hypothetical protein
MADVATASGPWLVLLAPAAVLAVALVSNDRSEPRALARQAIMAASLAAGIAIAAVLRSPFTGRYDRH